MLSIEGLAQALADGASLYTVGDGHADPGCRLHNSPVQPDGDRQGCDEHDARGGFHEAISEAGAHAWANSFCASRVSFSNVGQGMSLPVRFVLEPNNPF
jgi:hypothetical protein